MGPATASRTTGCSDAMTTALAALVRRRAKMKNTRLAPNRRPPNVERRMSSRLRRFPEARSRIP